MVFLALENELFRFAKFNTASAHSLFGTSGTVDKWLCLLELHGAVYTSKRQIGVDSG